MRFLRLVLGFLLIQSAVAQVRETVEAPSYLATFLSKVDISKLDLEGELDFTKGTFDWKYQKLTGSFLMKDFFEEDLRGNNPDEMSRAFLPILHFGRPGLQVDLEGLLTRAGDFTLSVLFKDEKGPSYFPVDVMTKKLGRVGLKIESIQSKSRGVNLTEGFLSEEAVVKGKCFLDGKIKAKPNQWIPVECRVGLKFDQEKKKWSFTFKIQAENLVSSDKQPSICETSFNEVKDQLVAKLQEFKDNKEEIPSLFLADDSSYVSMSGEMGEDFTPNLQIHFFMKPQMREVAIPGAPFGIRAKVPKNTILSLCYDNSATGSKPFLVVNAFKLEREYLVLGHKKIRPAHIKIRWNPIKKASDSAFEFIEDIPVAGFVTKLIHQVATPVLSLPENVLGELIPIADVDRLILSQETLRFEGEGVIQKEYKLSK